MFCGAFPDIHVTIHDLIAEGDLVAVRWTATMTHLGGHLGFAATAKRGSLDGSSFILTRDGYIVEAWNQMDLTGLIQRLKDS